jgi:hypothetical protein
VVRSRESILRLRNRGVLGGDLLLKVVEGTKNRLTTVRGDKGEEEVRVADIRLERIKPRDGSLEASGTRHDGGEASDRGGRGLSVFLQLLCEPFLVESERVHGPSTGVNPQLEGIKLCLKLADGRGGNIGGVSPRGERQSIVIEDIEKSGRSLGNRVSNAVARVKGRKGTRQEDGGVSGVLEDDTISVAVEREAAGGNDITDITERGPNVLINARHGPNDFFEPEDGNLKGINGLDVPGGGRIEGLMIDDRRSFEEKINRGTIKEIKGNATHVFAREGALKETTPFVEVVREFGQKGVGLSVGIKLKENTPGAICPFADFPVSPQPVEGCERNADLVKQVWAGVMSDDRVDRDEYVIDGIAFITGNNADGGQGVVGVALRVLAEHGA